jgi:tetratricopeptide (TPR) repeat protein
VVRRGPASPSEAPAPVGGGLFRATSFAPDHPNTLDFMNMLATLCRKQGRYEEAEPLAVECLDAARRKLGQRHPITLERMVDLTILCCDLGRYAEAEGLLRDCREIRPEELAPGEWRIAYTKSMFGDCLAKQGKFSEAEPLLLGVI